MGVNAFRETSHFRGNHPTHISIFSAMFNIPISDFNWNMLSPVHKMWIYILPQIRILEISICLLNCEILNEYSKVGDGKESVEGGRWMKKNGRCEKGQKQSGRWVKGHTKLGDGRLHTLDPSPNQIVCKLVVMWMKTLSYL